MSDRKSYNPLLKSYPDSEKINRVSEGAEVLYVRLLAASDDEHHYYADPGRVLAKLFTERMLAGQVTREDVVNRLADLDLVDLIRLYEVEGNQYLEIVQCFKKFRADVKLDRRFPMPEMPPIPYSARTRDEGVPDAGRTRTEKDRQDSVDVPPTQPNPTQPKLRPKPKTTSSATDDAFAAFWDAVPKKRKSGKRAARTAYDAAAKRLTLRWGAPSPQKAHDHLLERMTAFAASPKAQGEFCPMPTTWLNQDRFDDDPAAWEQTDDSKPRDVVADIQARRRAREGTSDD